MREFCLNEEFSKDDIQLRLMLSQLRKLNEDRVFRTWIMVDSKLFQFVTTSKDIHLGIGKLSHCSQVRLCKLFLSELESGDMELLFSITDKDGEVRNHSKLYVTEMFGETDGNEEVVGFHLSSLR